MNNVIQFPNSDVKEYRQKCCFMNRAVQVEGEDGEVLVTTQIYLKQSGLHQWSSCRRNWITNGDIQKNSMSKVALWQSIQESLSAHLIREWLMKKILMIASNRDIYSTAWDANTTDLQKLSWTLL